MRKKTLWNEDWEFWADASCGMVLDAEPHPWQNVTLPHDWQIWHVQDLYRDGTGWYRKTLFGNPDLGKRWCIFFEGVYMDTAVFVNGVLVKEWKYGYSSFFADVTDFLRAGDNTVLVRCCLRHPNSRWYSGAGIYRDVWLLEYPQSHLITDGLYIHTQEQEQGVWKMRVEAETEGASPGDMLELTLLDATGKQVTAGAVPAGNVGILTVENPGLWDTENPCCYQLQVCLRRKEETLDVLESTCGFRTIRLDPEQGLLLNHRRLVLHGVALHHDLGCLGAAFSMAAARRQLEIMQQMGVNALRTGHNMPAPGILELADQMGILVMDEAFDCWEKCKTEYDYARFFPEWYREDVASWVRRDRNHPCLLMWSIGNEIYDTHQDASGRETMNKLLAEVARHDPLKNGYVTFGSNYMGWENTQKCAGALDAVGYNYGENLYAEHHRKHPEWVIYGSETASIVQSRGIYHFPLSQPLLVDDDLQCSSLGNSRTSWGAKNHQACLLADEAHPFSMGQFLWSGIDYIGEPTPYHTKSSYYGLVDTAGFPKDAYYQYQAGWHSWQDKPVLHLLPYWDFNPGQMIDICVYSNLPQVELIVNGVSQGRKLLKGGADVRACWRVPYAPGSIRAVGYDSRGEVAEECEECSFSNSVKLQIKADREIVDNSGRDLVFCTISAVDCSGHPVRNANDVVRVEVSGSLVLVGLDNGNSADFDEYKTTVRQLFSGKLLAVAAGWGDEGIGRISVSGAGLEPAWTEVQVRPAQGRKFPVLPAIPDREAPTLLPVRKIELRADRTALTKEHPAARLVASVEPKGAAAEALSWRVTNNQGITVPNVELRCVEGAPGTVQAIGVGDGAVRVRCSLNGILSELEMTVEGMGTMCCDPYQFLSAALYTSAHGEIGNGNERGIATDRAHSSWVAYENMDFGRAGADRLTISVFELAGIPTPIRFWKGIPHAPGSVMVGERIYDRPSRWNVYQDASYQLDAPLVGRDVFGIELGSKVHIKGFVFERRSRAWERLSAMDYDLVYGDRFTLTETAVEGIGNNVSLVFRELDFGEKGADKLVLRGKSKLKNNTIHLRFEGADTTEQQILEFPGADTWKEILFPLERIRGKQDVTFLFLPGCNFDFLDFRFLPPEEG